MARGAGAWDGLTGVPRPRFVLPGVVQAWSGRRLGVVWERSGALSGRGPGAVKTILKEFIWKRFPF